MQIMANMRLDKLLVNTGIGSRKEVKQYIKQGIVMINNNMASDPGMHVDPEKDSIYIDGNKVEYRDFYYIMLNKPKDVISATWDSTDTTVIDLLPPKYGHVDLFPAGRLDKDTEGLILLTNDGKLSHSLLSPKKKVGKTYFAIIDGCVTQRDIDIFKNGIKLEDDFITLPAQLEIIKAGDKSEVYVTIYEGKFHQIKRMFKYIDKKVAYLKRISIGPLVLDQDLELGEFRELTAQEIEALNNI